MASAHLSAQVISRGGGHSAVEASAYRARAALHDERTGETHDYTRARSKCVFEGIYAPKDAPEWAHDRARLWNHVEAFEKHRRAELAHEINIALPHELTLEQNRWLLQDWVKENATRKGLIADVAIHEPDPRGDERNVHAHVMIVRRKLDGSEFVRTKERFDTFSEKQAAKEADLAAMRSSWERLANKHLERHGHEARIDMGRKQDGEATLHMGKHATAQERRGLASELGDLNREIEAGNARRRAANENAPAKGFTTTLDGIRQREAQQSRDSTAETVHALDDLARTDPLGTARHFGHRLGDRPKSPEDMRREMSALLRGLSAEPQPAPAMDRRSEAASPEPTRDPVSPNADRKRTGTQAQSQAWTAQNDGWNGLGAAHQSMARQAFEAWRGKRDPADTRPAFTLPEYVDYVQQREARKREHDTERPVLEPSPRERVETRRAPRDSRAAWAATLRALAEDTPPQRDRRPEPGPGRGTAADRPRSVTPPQTRLAAAPRRGFEERTREAGRGPEAVRQPTTSVDRPGASSASQERPAASYLRAALSSARERLHSLGARLENVRAAIMARAHGRDDAHTAGGRMAREDTSSRKVNSEAAAEQRTAERQAKARAAAASRATAREFDRQQDARQHQEERRVRRSIWEEDLRAAEIEEAAERLRRALERPGEHDHSRERNHEPRR